MIKEPEDYSHFIESLFQFDSSRDVDHRHVISVTLQVTNDCCLKCTYCYQINKSPQHMSWETAKACADFILQEANNPESILSYNRNVGIIFDFIGGEPLMNFEVVAHFIDYMEKQLLKQNSPWILYHKYSFSSNGVLYFDPLVQQYLKKYHNLISMSITVDGDKALHDMCRLFPDGRGSYDLAIAAALDQKDKWGNDATKITLAPANVHLIANAIINMYELGFKYIHANCCFEEGWKIEHAQILYQQLKILADYIIDNNLEPVIGFRMFETSKYTPTDINAQNWCGGTGKMLAIDYKGDIYPCLRYADVALGKDQPPIIIGNINRGIYQLDSEKAIWNEFQQVTLKSQSPEKCLTCSIGAGCAWCSAYNYQATGSFNKRVTFICDMHKAQALATYYFWHKNQQVHGTPTDFTVDLPMEDIEAIIGIDEWNYLQSL